MATSVALVSGVMLPAAGSATAAPKPSVTEDRRGPEAPRDYDITLITGDVVHYTDGAGNQDTVTVDRPDGAEGGVHVQQAGDDIFVIPDEASTLVAAGKLDHAAVRHLDAGGDGVRRRPLRRHPADRHLPGGHGAFAARRPARQRAGPCGWSR